MPPRIQSQRVSSSVLPYISSSPSSTSSSSCTSCHRPFSTTPALQTRLRNQMFEWLHSEGRRLRYHEAGIPKYVTNLRELGSDNPQQMSQRPFPLNPNFVSEPILSEEMRQEIYRRVTRDRRSVRAVSIEMKVDMRRVAAVVRLVEMEKAWKSQVSLSLFCLCSAPLFFFFFFFFFFPIEGVRSA